MMRQLFLFIQLIISLIIGCVKAPEQDPYVVVLGIAQDGGAPHAGCQKDCCAIRWNDPSKYLMVSSIGIVDPNTKETWMIDATPDFPKQLEILTGNDHNKLKGIFLTHAHIGHYTGLMFLGREVMGSNSVPVYAMPKMAKYLRSNGPWSQLVDLENIVIEKLKDERSVKLNDRIKVTPFQVPHRDEFSETVGYKIEGANKSVIFIPDIDKWSKWDKDIVTIVKENDYAILDGSFYQNGEIIGRDMSEIPHPFIIESLETLKSSLDNSEVYFIHLNHTNPALIKESEAQKQILKAGFKIAEPKQIINF
mgnify:FL=1